MPNKREQPLVVDEEGDNDYVLKDKSTGADVWIGIENISVCVHRTDEGVVIDVFGPDRGRNADEEMLATTYAFFADAEFPDDEDTQGANDGKDLRGA